MEEKSTLLPKYKTYIGRVFLLRNFKQIPASTDRKAFYRRYYDKKETFGDYCFVCDEVNSRVKITTLNSGYLWIPKFYLKKEVVSDIFKKKDAIIEMIDKVLSLKENEANKEKQDILKQTSLFLRAYADTIKVA